MTAKKATATTKAGHPASLKSNDLTSRLILVPKPIARMLHAAGRRKHLPGFGQAEPRHVGIHALVAAGGYEIGLVIDPNRSVAAHTAVEIRPSRQMFLVPSVGVFVQVLKRTPILHDTDRAAADGGARMQQAQLWLLK